VIDTEEALTAGTMLDSIPEYDSMAVLMLLNWLDSKGINVSPADFEKFKTVGDILNLAKA
jgi:acyl carrier protein